jgi:nucleoside-diphosphate-sugar epimerase
VHFGSENEVQIAELGKIMLKLAGVDSEIELHDSPKGSVLRRSPDTTKLRGLIGFSEEFTLADGLRRTMDYYL